MLTMSMPKKMRGVVVQDKAKGMISDRDYKARHRVTIFTLGFDHDPDMQG
jgi:hypothetical protein